MKPAHELHELIKIKKINPKHEARNSKQIQNSKVQNSKRKQYASGAQDGVSCFEHLDFGHFVLFRISDFGFRIFIFPCLSVLVRGSFFSTYINRVKP